MFNGIQSSSVVRVARVARRRPNIVPRTTQAFFFYWSHLPWPHSFISLLFSVFLVLSTRIRMGTRVAAHAASCVQLENHAQPPKWLALSIKLYRLSRVALSRLVFMSKNKSQTFYRKINRICNFNYFGWLNWFAAKMFIWMIRIVARIHRRRHCIYTITYAK